MSYRIDVDFEVGQVVAFEYTNKNKKTGEVKLEKKVRLVKVEKIDKEGYIMRGFDYLADAPVGGYRTFHVERMENVNVKMFFPHLPNIIPGA